MNTLPKDIDAVLVELDRIIEESISANNALGIFAYVYRRTTAQIKEGILQKQFDDNARMEAFDVAFANLYIEAYRRHERNEEVSKSWNVAFQAKEAELTIIQHLIMGMNAHINLDLSLAANAVMNNRPIEDLRDDFMKVNNILFGLTQEMQEKISKVSFMMFLLDIIGKRSDEKIIDFSIGTARSFSWNNAVELAHLDGAAYDAKVDEIDRNVAGLSQRLIQPRSVISRFVLKIIRMFEVKEVAKIIEGLNA